MCRIERWSTRTLGKKIGGMLFERTALSRKPERLMREELARLREEDKLTPDLVFRDPYVLDFLGLRDTMARRTSNRRSSGRSRRSSWSSGSASRSWRGRSGSPSITMTII
jgi:predicted nuclease of restriction endonuclease-like (RecB) superfamily